MTTDSPVIITRNRAKAANWAGEAINDPTVVYLDTETTGLGSDAEICDIAIISFDGETLLDSLVKTTKPIPAEATAIHGISDEMVADAPSWADLYPTIHSLLNPAMIVVFNADYDHNIINQCCRLAGVPEFPFDGAWQCAMKAHADFAGVRDPRRGSLKWHKLDDAVRQFGGEQGGHRALADAIACRTVVLGMATIEL